MARAVEYNFDGLVGPTHHYGGLALGNIASQKNAKLISHPRQAAMQGIAKMKKLHEYGLPQAVLPPHPRPNTKFLRHLGFQGDSDKAVIAKAATEPYYLSCAYSSSHMWAANIATFSPSVHTEDAKIHITPANLLSNTHRFQEVEYSKMLLENIFNNKKYFIVHDPLPSALVLRDEGAANHSYICSDYGESGCELFVYGDDLRPKVAGDFLPRQGRQGSLTIARLHKLSQNKVVYARQNPKAIAAGVFHNDVIFTANKNVILYHEEAFVNTDEIISEIEKKLDHDICGIKIKKEQLTLEEAVATYLFNSQIVSVANKMIMLAPEECENSEKTRELLQQLKEDRSNPITEVFFVACRQSMQNGGGPACLRNRVVLTPKQADAIFPNVIVNDSLLQKLEIWVAKHYRDELSADDLADPNLLSETKAAFQELSSILQLPILACH